MKVALAGDGGDELWGGYPYYSIHNRARWLPRLNDSGFDSHPFSPSPHRRLARVAKDFRRDPGQLHERWRRLDPNGSFWGSILLPDFQRARFDWIEPRSAVNSHDSLLERDVRFYLPSDLLEKVDTMSMAHSLEVRVPWLDPVLFETIAHLPRSVKISGGITKWLLRKSAETGARRLPESVLHARKQGFGIPIHRWISDELRDRFLEGPLAKDSRLETLMDLVTLRRYYEAHRAGHVRLGHPLWAVLVLDTWLRQNRIAID